MAPGPYEGPTCGQKCASSRVVWRSRSHRTSAIEAAYQHFHLDKQGSLVSPKTMRNYEWTIRPFLRWLDEEYPQVMRFERLGVDLVREYRMCVAERPTNRGRLLEPATLNDLHRPRAKSRPRPELDRYLGRLRGVALSGI